MYYVDILAEGTKSGNVSTAYQWLGFHPQSKDRAFRYDLVPCIFILLRNMRRLGDEAERVFPGPLDLNAGEKKHDAEQDHKMLPTTWREL
jgi:hypothetical protein